MQLVSFYMSQVGQANSVTGTNIFLYLYENFSPVDWHKIRKTKPNRRKNAVCFATTVAFRACNMTNKESSYTSVYVLEINTRRNYAFLLLFCESEGNLSKTFRPCNWVEYSHGKIFITVAEISVTEPAHPLTWTRRQFYKWFSGVSRSRKPGQPGLPGSYEEALAP